MRKSLNDPLTSTCDLLVRVIAAVAIYFGVRIVQDRPALRMLHSISVTLIMHLAAPKNKSNKTKFEIPHIRQTPLQCCNWNVTCPDHPQVCRSLLFHSSSRSRRSQKQASCRASRRGSFFWTGEGPGSPRTGLMGDKQVQWETRLLDDACAAFKQKRAAVFKFHSPTQRLAATRKTIWKVFILSVTR